jgi:hypothetical protein
MQLDMNELVLMARIVKAGAEDDEPSKPKPKKKSTKPKFTHAYPDYSRSIVTQQRQQPHEAGIQRGLGTGSVGAILGALIARLLSDKPSHVAGGAAAGGLLGGIPGYISGSEQAKSDYTKLLALRRSGINTPAEYEQAMTFPTLADKLTAEGFYL